MSYFLCGNLFFKNHFKAPQIKIDHKILGISETAANLGLNFTTDIGGQDSVLDLLVPKKKQNKELIIQFMIVEFSDSDTSDSLISPYSLVDESSDYITLLKRQMVKIDKFVKSLFEDVILSSLEMIFSEGYDTNYEVFDISINRFLKTTLSYAKKKDDLHGLRIIIRNNSGAN